MLLPFSPVLKKGVILSRPNRFIMRVKSRGELLRCFCPTPTKIGKIVFKNVPCLISANSAGLKTTHTVEAFVYKKITIGINQIEINNYYKKLIEAGSFSDLMPTMPLQREITSGESKFDFGNDKILLEVKMPLTVLPNYIDERISNFNHEGKYERTIKQYLELARQAKKGRKTLVFISYIYDAPPYNPIIQNKNNHKLLKAIFLAQKNKTQFWQNNFNMTKEGVALQKTIKLWF
jgi:sugar fermentation stimulation protein A